MADYTGLSGYNDVYQKLIGQLQALNSDHPGTRVHQTERLNTVMTQFSRLFENLVGRGPNDDELGQFLNEKAGNIILNAASGTGRIENDTQNVRDITAQYIGDNFQKAAEDNSKQQLIEQQAQANELANLFRSQGTTAINATEQSLLDYQQRLFERLRPNLITSLQAQGLLNTGALNETIAGKQADLAAEGANYLRDIRLQNEQQANQIAFSGAAAPYEFERGNILNQVPFLQQQGQGALDRNYNTYLKNLDFAHASLLQQMQQGGQPSFLKQLGGQILGNTLSTFIPGVGGRTGYNWWQRGGQPMPGTSASIPASNGASAGWMA